MTAKELADKYVGKPFASKGNDTQGFNCMSLVCAVYKDLGVDIDNKWKAFAHDAKEVPSIFIAELAAAESGISRWVPSTIKEGSIVVFKVSGVLKHVGIMLDDQKFLHSLEKIGVCIEDINNPLWNKRIRGVYEWSA